MRPLSNITQIAAAAGLIHEKLPQTYFLFAAPAEERDETYETEVRRVLREAGVADNARFVGPIPHYEMADYHRLADVTISIPSTDGTPMTVLESMACGTPVVVSDIPDYDPHYIEPGATVLAAKYDDTTSVAGTVLKLLQEPATAARLVAEARRRVEETGSYEAQMSHMERLYKELG